MRQGYVYAGVRKGLNGQKGCISKGCISKGCMSKEVSVRAAHLALQQGRQHNQPPPVVKGHAGRAVRSAPAAAVARYVIPRSAVRPHPRAQGGGGGGGGGGPELRVRAAGSARVPAASLSSAHSRHR